MKFTNTQRVTLGVNTTVAELKTWLNTIPPQAKVSVDISKGDRPYGSDTTTMEATWSSES